MGLDILVNISKILQVSLDELFYAETGIPNQKTVINNKITKLLEDCTPCQMLVIYDIIKATKESLRNTYPPEEK